MLVLNDLSVFMPTFTKISTLPSPAKDVFAWHARPEALPTLIPPWESVEVEQPPRGLAPGTVVVLVNRMGPLRLRWVAEHTEFVDRGESGGPFVDIQREGPFKTWIHRHDVTPSSGGGAVLTDTVEWELPFAPFGRWIAGAWAERKIRRMFDFRHEATREAVLRVVGGAT